MLSEMIRMGVDDTIQKTFKDKPDVVSYLINHGKKKKLIGNLITEISLANLKGNASLKRKNIKEIVESFTKMFAHAALTQKEQEIKAARNNDVKEMFVKE